MNISLGKPIGCMYWPETQDGSLPSVSQCVASTYMCSHVASCVLIVCL